MKKSLLFLITSIVFVNAQTIDYPLFQGTFDGTVYDEENGTFEFPSSAQSWAGFANQTEIYPLAFPNGGKITFNAATTGAEDIVVKFKFERLTYNAEGNGAADTEPSFETATATVSGTESSEYVVDIAPRPATETYSSALLYLITQDQVLTASDFVITSYD